MLYKWYTYITIDIIELNEKGKFNTEIMNVVFASKRYI